MSFEKQALAAVEPVRLLFGGVGEWRYLPSLSNP
jgi:hypothetical protein